MNNKVLLVDDEPHVLDALRRHLRKRYDLTCATSGAEGLQYLQSGQYAVVVSDMRMPEMDGATFLTAVRQSWPDVVRMVLSGQSEIAAVVEAINKGHIFRFLVKPCPPEVIAEAIDTGLEQFRLKTVERELLQQTLTGAVQVLTEVLSLVNPVAFSRGSRVQNYAEQIASKLGREDAWEIKLAAMLSQIGCVALPQDTLARHEAGQELTAAEQEMLTSHPEVAGRLLRRIPRLERVADMVACQLQSAPATVDGAEILQTSIEFDRLLSLGMERKAILEDLGRKISAPMLDALGALEKAQGQMAPRAVHVEELRLKMVLDEDVLTAKGMRLMPKGQEVTEAVLTRLRNFAEGVGVVEPFRVLVPH